MRTKGEIEFLLWVAVRKDILAMKEFQCVPNFVQEIFEDIWKPVFTSVLNNTALETPSSLCYNHGQRNAVIEYLAKPACKNVPYFDLQTSYNFGRIIGKEQCTVSDLLDSYRVYCQYSIDKLFAMLYNLGLFSHQAQYVVIFIILMINVMHVMKC